jgi:hypothetical protein
MKKEYVDQRTGRRYVMNIRPAPGGFQPVHPGREMDVYRFIIRHKLAHDGCSPSRRQIAEAVGIGPKATGMVYQYLRKLAEKGLIKYNGSVQAVEVVGGRWTAPCSQGLDMVLSGED